MIRAVNFKTIIKKKRKKFCNTADKARKKRKNPAHLFCKHKHNSKHNSKHKSAPAAVYPITGVYVN